MSSRIIYPLQRSGSLLFLRASATGLVENDFIQVRLLIDTGSAYTTLPLQLLEDIGYNLGSVQRRIPIMTASGMGRAPIISIATFNCLGKTMTDFSVVALNLPFNPLMSGLLGMDFLNKVGATIDTRKAEITMER
jgi:predicted aspartyl protease